MQSEAKPNISRNPQLSTSLNYPALTHGLAVCYCCNKINQH